MCPNDNRGRPTMPGVGVLRKDPLGIIFAAQSAIIIYVFMHGGEMVSWIATCDATRGNIAHVTALSARNEADVISCVDARMDLTVFRDHAEKFHRIRMHGKSDLYFTNPWRHLYSQFYKLLQFLGSIYRISVYKITTFSRKKVTQKCTWT